MEIIKDPVFQLLERGLDLSLVRQNLLVNNVANVETPNYERQDVNFEAYLRKSEERENLWLTHPRHLLPDNGETSLTKGAEEYAVRQDGGGVDVEKEMTLVLENSIYYQTLTRMISEKFGLLETVIKEVR
ncbi:MAG: flagellar basal-body rod protein FlgB [Candidatus Atribacteria bacterium]|jgi:flagellar basal-body rod protein FlgB|nr:flagellar basal-body rod protein FlgB [Candidatus Atribacteria bacterium]